MSQFNLDAVSGVEKKGKTKNGREKEITHKPN